MDKIVSVRQCAAERGAFCVVHARQGLLWAARLHFIEIVDLMKWEP